MYPDTVNENVPSNSGTADGLHSVSNMRCSIPSSRVSFTQPENGWCRYGSLSVVLSERRLIEGKWWALCQIREFLHCIWPTKLVSIDFSINQTGPYERSGDQPFGSRKLNGLPNIFHWHLTNNKITTSSVFIQMPSAWLGDVLMYVKCRLGRRYSRKLWTTEHLNRQGKWLCVILSATSTSVTLLRRITA